MSNTATQPMLPGLGRRKAERAACPEQKLEASVERLQHTRIQRRSVFAQLTDVASKLEACTNCCSNEPNKEDKS